MTKTFVITETNPAIFVQALEGAIKDGFYVQNTNAGAPSLATLLEIVLFSDPVPEAKPSKFGDGEEICISHYESLPFLLDVQNAILLGYSAIIESVNFYGIKEVRMKKAVAVQPTEEQQGPRRGRKAKA